MKPKPFLAHGALTPMTPKTSPLTQESLLIFALKGQKNE
jgi:hypothetical protein